MENDKGILLEAGTNEMELLVFKLGPTPFGINVAKVREIVQRTKTINIPYSPYGVEGSFKLRDKVLTLVNLGSYFNMQGEQTINGDGMIVVVEFNNILCGVLVDEVERIHRLNWEQINPPSQFLMNMSVPVTGTVLVDDKTILIADFESIVSEILGFESAAMPDDVSDEPIDKKQASILLADDSSVLRTALTRILNFNGYENLTVCSDGQEAWEQVDSRRGSDQQFELVLTDIEMPRMDGLHLTSKIKNDNDLKDIPVVLFSSLITADNKRKGESVGADAQVSKPDSKSLIGIVENCLAKSKELVSSK